MGTRYLIGEWRTGRRIVNLPIISGTWSDDIDSPEAVSVTVALGNKVVRGLNLRNSATVAKTFLAAIDTGPFGQSNRVLAAGPIWDVAYSRPAKTLTLTAKGAQSIFDHLLVLPASAAGQDVTTWTIPDPADPSGVGTIPNPAVATSYTTYSLGGIAVMLVTQALSWPGGNLPIVLPAPEAGVAVRTYQGADFKTVGSALTDLVNVLGGPEINFLPRFTSDQLGIEWLMQVGTTAQPLIFGADVVNWNVTAKDSPVKDLTIDLDGSNMASYSWATGGSQNDIALISRAANTYLTDIGYPLMMTVDSTHSDVVIQATLDGYAGGNLVYASAATENWAFTVKAHPLDKNGDVAGAQLDDYNVGDFVNLHIDQYDDKTNRGDLYIPEGGNIALRIIGIAGDQDGDDVTISCSPVVGS